MDIGVRAPIASASPSRLRAGSSDAAKMAAMQSAKLAVNCIGIIGKQNEPIFIKNFTSQPELKYHYLCHISLDVVEERIAALGGRFNDLYLGLLTSIEDLAIYGYMTNTKIKFIVIVQLTDALIKDADVKSLFRRIHAAYVNLVSNPFFDLDTNRPISPKWTTVIEAVGR
ncbi:Sedlin, N-terminal conserved region-domain-containing protein [Hyaloraphidium curvatum]|nr:Sedlin, N-terminal conserved region-domain-containing protein [Hyaloraphidium curvatum]